MRLTQTPSAADGDETTRQRLIEAAGEIFAEHGFRTATIRQISARAGANVAAVNYHFGGKDALYAHALRFAHACAVEKYPPDMGIGAGAAAPRRLEAFVRSFLLRLLDAGRPAWHARLMARELAEPTAALDVLVNEQIKPHFIGLMRTVRELMGPAAPDSAVRAACSSVVGQCLFYHFGATITHRLFPGAEFSARDVDALASHVTRFSLAGMRAVAKSPATRHAVTKTQPKPSRSRRPARASAP